jgi:hypothetical protein|tara:strand:- start:242 stop:367 length:126 start_codon:yes stop_codon:yes gene_type:complete
MGNEEKTMQEELQDLKKNLLKGWLISSAIIILIVIIKIITL